MRNERRTSGSGAGTGGTTKSNLGNGTPVPSSPEKRVAGRPIIEHGDWRRHRKELGQ